jgi:hypothetical protein
MSMIPVTPGSATPPSPSVLRGHVPRRAADVYFISYPRSGRTWLRALVGKALVDHCRLPEEMLLDMPAVTRSAGLPVAAFDHGGSGLRRGSRWQDLPTDRSFYRGKRVLLIGRDVRDNLVSAYFQATRRISVFDGPISAFIRHDAYGIEKILAFYAIWHANRHVPAAFDFVRYEDLHRDTAGTLVRVLAFLGADVAPATITAAVEYCRFENMRKAEVEDRFRTSTLRSARDGDPEAFKMRKGKVGNYAEYLAPGDIAWIDAAVAAQGCEFTRAAITPAP